MEQYSFRQWSNTGYAVFNSLQRVVHICTLSVAYSLLVLPTATAQGDTTTVRPHYQLEEVEAVGDSEEQIIGPTIRMITRIARPQITTAPARSIADLLEYHPQVDVRTRGSHGIQSDLSIRGGSFDQSLVLLNGINMSDPQTGHFSLDLPVSLFQADHVELVAGPATRLYGLNAYSGAVNVETNPADSLQLEGLVEYGSHGLFNASVNADVPMGPVSTMVALHRSASEGYRENTDFLTRTVYLHSRAVAGMLAADLMAGATEKAFGANAFYTPKYPGQYEETSGRFMAVHLRSQGLRPALGLQLYRRRHTDHFMLFRDNPGAYENHHLSHAHGVRLSGQISSRAGITDLALKFRNERIISSSLGEALDSPVPVEAADSTWYDRGFARNHLTMTLNHNLEKGPLRLGAGAFIHSGGRILSAGTRDASPGIYPGIDMSLKIAKKLRWYTSLNRSMRLPTFTDLFYEGPQNRGNPELKPETAVSLESGFRLNQPAFRTDFSAFYRNGNQIIDWVWEGDQWHTRNIASLNTVGVLAAVEVCPSTLAHRLDFLERIGFSYGYTAIDRDAGSYISNYALDHLKHKLAADLRFSLPLDGYLDVKALWQDRNGTFGFYSSPDALPVETPYDPFWKVDMAAGFRFGRTTFYGKITNVLDVEYRDTGSVIMPGRWLTAGIRVGPGIRR